MFSTGKQLLNNTRYASDRCVSVMRAARSNCGLGRLAVASDSTMLLHRVELLCQFPPPSYLLHPNPCVSVRAPKLQGWLIDAIEVLVVSFVLDDIAVTFQLDSFSKGLVGSASFFGKPFRGVASLCHPPGL